MHSQSPTTVANVTHQHQGPQLRTAFTMHRQAVLCPGPWAHRASKIGQNSALALLGTLLPALALGRVCRRGRALGRALGVLRRLRHIVQIAAVRARHLHRQLMRS